MSKALIEKAREYYFSLLPQGNMPTIIGCSIENTPEYRAFIAGATWQREQLIKELREWIKDKGIETNDFGTVVGKKYIIAKLDDLLEGEK